MKPDACLIYWKYETEPLSRARLAVQQRCNYTADADGAVDGIQNVADVLGPLYDRDSETVNLLLVPQYVDGSREVIRWLPIETTAVMDDVGGIDEDDQTVVVLKPTRGTFQAGDVVRIQNEFCRILQIETNTPDANHDRWTIRRGLHGSEGVSHATGTAFRLYGVSVEMAAVTLTGSLAGLPAPSDLIATPYVNAIRLTWTSNIPADRRQELDTFVLFWRDTTFGTFDANDSGGWPSGITAEDTGPNTNHVFYPVAGGVPDTTNPRYFRVAARDQTGVYSGLTDVATATAAEEGTGTGGDTEVPDPDDPSFVWDADFTAAMDGTVHVVIGAQAIEQGASADRIQFKIRVYEGPAVNFDPDEDDPFTGTVWESATVEAPHPGTAWFSELSYATRYELTLRVRNAFGWSAWMTPVELDIGDESAFDHPWAQTPTGSPYLSAFAAWTRDNPPPGDDPNLGSGMVRFTWQYGLNSATSFYLHVIGYTGSFPAETLRLSQADGTATTTRGTLEVTVSGYSATTNQFAGKFFRIGRENGVIDTPLQEMGIASHTTGNPFTITLKDHGWKITSHGTLTYWEIVDKPLREVADWHRAYKIDTPSGPGGTYRTDQPETFYQPLAHLTTMKYAARLEGMLGRGPWRHSDNTTAGTEVQANAVAKVVAQVAKDDQQKSARKLTVTGLAATNVTDNDIDIGSGTVYYSATVSESINARSFSGLSYSTAYWLYKIIGLAGIESTTSVTDVENPAYVPLGAIITPADSTGRITWEPFNQATSRVISADRVIARYLSAISADLGTITAGLVTGATLRTAASGARIEQNSTDGIKVVDSSENVRVQIPTSATEIAFRVNDSTPGYIKWGTLAQLIAHATGPALYLLPQTDAAGYLRLGGSPSNLRWQGISGLARSDNSEVSFKIQSETNAAYYAEMLGGVDTTSLVKAWVSTTRGSGNSSSYSGSVTASDARAAIYAEWSTSTQHAHVSCVATTSARTVDVLVDNTSRLLISATEVNASVRLRPYQLKLDRSIGGWTNATEVLDGSNALRGYIGEGAANLYGLSLGESSADRGALQLKSRSTATQKPGTLILYSADGTPHYITVSNDGKLRINTSDPNGNDTTGTIVGTQTA